MLIKICGFKSIDVALAAAEAGADMIGLNFYPSSPRFIQPDQAARICASLPESTCPVGLFVNEPVGQIRSTAEICGFSIVQLHGDYSQDDIDQLAPLQVIRAVGIDADPDLEGLGKIRADFILLDTAVKGMYGGTGRSFDWSLAARARRHTESPIILAGGLRNDNVLQAIRVAQPDGVDIAGGVESLPGVKDIKMIEEFIRTVRQTDIGAT